ncbi:MAG: hypothetical protein CVU91_11825 [Firmicutes bacterium HGW-Firmicutes-16]|nr:MAG: hypothetical protein CVU91_11825 [Firmicutes bacterium HGW-Firmicutes-16]
MAIEIYIVSGFLGAGKTTFVHKLLKESFRDKKVVLIENDFGEISVDAALMKSLGVTVRELNSGCICCSLSGDFIKSLKEVSERFHPDIVLIEPSGVGKLSDIVAACEDKRLSGLFTVKAKIAIADAKRCRMYLENFGEFFEDQIRHANTIVLSRTEDAETVKKALGLIHELNPEASVFSIPWESFSADNVLLAAAQTPETHCHEACCTHEHSHTHENNGCCEHDYGAEKIFDTVTLRTEGEYSPEELKARFSRLTQSLDGKLLRAKGIVNSKNGCLELQYVQDELKIAPTETRGDIICFIGKGLKSSEFNAVFNGK